jgi:hypothetical protein
MVGREEAIPLRLYGEESLGCIWWAGSSAEREIEVRQAILRDSFAAARILMSAGARKMQDCCKFRAVSLEIGVDCTGLRG